MRKVLATLLARCRASRRQRHRGARSRSIGCRCYVRRSPLPRHVAPPPVLLSRGPPTSAARGIRCAGTGLRRTRRRSTTARRAAVPTVAGDPAGTAASITIIVGKPVRHSNRRPRGGRSFCCLSA